MSKKLLPHYKHELEITAECRPGFFFMKEMSFMEEKEKKEHSFRTAMAYFEALDSRLPSSAIVSLPVFEDYERDIPLSTMLGTYELGFYFTIVVFAEDLSDLIKDTQTSIECIRAIAKEKHPEIFAIFIEEPSRPILIGDRKYASTARKSLLDKQTADKQSPDEK